MSLMIHTPRTTIRPIEYPDEPDLFDIYKCPEVFENFGSGVYTRQEHQASIERAVQRWQDIGKGDLVAVYNNKVIAPLILFPIGHEDYEIGYVLNPKFWGLGLATEIATVLTDFAFSLGALSVKACVRETNLISKRIILKLGYVEIGKEFGEDGVNRLYFKKDKATS